MTADSNELEKTPEEELSPTDEQLQGASGGVLNWVLGPAITHGLTAGNDVQAWADAAQLNSDFSDTLKNQEQRLENAQYIEQKNSELEAALIKQIGRSEFENLRAKTIQQLADEHKNQL